MNNPQVMMPAASGENIPPLPRITVEVFCERPETVAVMQAVVSDRRMMRTHTQIYSGGIAAAAQYHAQTPTPNLLVVESSAAPDQLIASLSALSQVCSAETKVIVLGHVNDINLYQSLIAQGISDYITAPFSTAQVLASFSRQFASENAVIGKVVTFMGAKGGVGSSVIAHNIAWLMSEKHGSGTVIADLDLAFGTAGLDFDADPAQGIIDALSSKDRLDSTFIDRLLHKCSERLMLLASPASVDRVTDIPGETLDVIIDILRSTTPCTVIDLPTTWSDWMKVVLSQTDKLVIVSTLELAALRNTKSLVDNIKSVRPSDEPPLLVINQAEMGGRPEIPLAKFSSAVGLEVASVIPFDAKVFGQALNAGKMIPQVAPKSPAAQEFEKLTRRLLDIEEPEDKKGGSLFKPLLDKLKKKSK